MYFKEILIPENVNVEFSTNDVKVSGPKGNLEKRMKPTKDIKIEKHEKNIKISSESDRRKTKALVGTMIANIRNMIDGVTKGFVYRLKVIYTHFPVTVKVEGNKVMIQNFLGERTPRTARIFGKTDVKIDGQEVTLSGIDIDDVSLTAGSIEQACRVRARDRRVFQDGVWIVSKG